MRLIAREPRRFLYEPRLLRGQQRPVHIAAGPPRLRGAIVVLPRPDEAGREVIPRLAYEGVRVREQEIAHGDTLIRER
jgi:hypothetical protein